MGASIAGLLIMAVFFTGALMLFRTTLLGNVLVGSAMREANDLLADRARTSIRITSTDGDGTCNLTVRVENNGATSISDYQRMDVIALFNSATTTPQRLTYTSTTPPTVVGQWATTTISGAFELDIFNPGETMTLRARLLIGGVASGAVTVGTPNGITASRSFPEVDSLGTPLFSLAPC